MPRWTDTVSYLPSGEAIRPDQLLVSQDDVDAAIAEIGAIGWEHVPEDADDDRLAVLKSDGTPDVAASLDALLQAGISAQPNHVLFATAPGAGGSPTQAAEPDLDEIYAIPLEQRASDCPPHPTTGIPGRWQMYSKVHPSPLHASPLHASSYIADGTRDSTVVRAGPPPEWTERGRAGAVVVAIIDTGLPTDQYRPQSLAGEHATGPPDEPNSDPLPDRLLDPVAGHGLFIAGVVSQAAPHAKLRHIGLIGPAGDLDEHTLANKLRELAVEEEPPQVLNLSIAGYAFRDMNDLALAVLAVQRRGTIVVAAAGNDATCRPAYPAALDGVIGVGAVDADGRPAPFSNYGPWVTACAPGVDIHSYFFVGWTGQWKTNAPDEMAEGWALWSGTSFAAPYVAGRIADALVTTSAAAAVANVLAGPTVPLLGQLVT